MLEPSAKVSWWLMPLDKSQLMVFSVLPKSNQVTGLEVAGHLAVLGQKYGVG
jgi:hypothetical protein